MADNNIKGWIGFLVIIIVITGGVFGISHIIKSPASSVTISSVSSNLTTSSDYNATSSILNYSVSPSSLAINVTVDFTTTTAGATVNYTVVSPSITNVTKYNNYYNNITYPKLFKEYSQNFNSSYNKTYNGTPSYNLTAAYIGNLTNIRSNASSNASAEAYANSTYSFINPLSGSITEKAKTSNGSISFNLKLNATAVALMSAGQASYIKIDLSNGATGYIGYLEIYRS